MDFLETGNTVNINKCIQQNKKRDFMYDYAYIWGWEKGKIWLKVRKHVLVNGHNIQLWLLIFVKKIEYTENWIKINRNHWQKGKKGLCCIQQQNKHGGGKE